MLQEPTNLVNAVMHVALQDVSMADAPARTIASTRHKVSGDALQTLPFQLEVPQVPSPSRRYTLAAEIRAEDHVQVQAGDFLSTITVRWSPKEGRQVRWRIPVQRLKL